MRLATTVGGSLSFEAYFAGRRGIRPDIQTAQPEVDWSRIIAAADYYRQEFHPPAKRLWDEAQEAIGPLKAILGHGIKAAPFFDKSR